MKRTKPLLSRIPLFIILLSLVVAATLAPTAARAQDKSATATRRDVDCRIQTNGDVQVIETWEVHYAGGPFTEGFRGVNLRYVDSVDDFHMSEAGQDYQPGSTQAPGTFIVYQDKGQQFVKWFYTPTSDATRTFNVRYTLHGIVRLYDDGDLFWYDAIEPDRGYPIQDTTVTVHLPANFPVEKLDAEITTGQGNATVRDGQTVVFTSSELKPTDGLVVRVDFPHGVVTAAKPKRQVLVDTADEYYQKGLDHARVGQFADALADLNEAIKLIPDDYSDYYVMRGNIYDDLGDLNHALEDYARAIEINPSDGNAYHERGYAYERQNKLVEAIADYTLAIKCEPKNAEYVVHRAQAYYKQGNLDLTLANANNAIELDSRNKAAYYFRGYVSLNQAKYDEAIADATKAIELDARFALAYEVRGLAYVAKLDNEHGISDLQTYLKLAPNAEDRGTIEGALKSLAATPGAGATTPTATSTSTNMSYIAFTSNRDGNHEIYLMRGDGSKQTRLTNSPEDEYFAKLSPDGSGLLYWRTKAGGADPIFELDWMLPDGSHGIFANHVSGYSAFSADGQVVLLTQYDDKGKLDISRTNIRGGPTTRLTTDPADDFSPTFSPDAKRIAFVSTRDGTSHVWVMNADGSDPHRLTQNKASEFDPAWSPDGALIAFAAGDDLKTNIFTIAPDGTNQKQLTDEKGYNEYPAWSPDGTMIAFWSNRTGNKEIFAMEQDGSEVVNLTNHPADDEEPSWSK